MTVNTGLSKHLTEHLLLIFLLIKRKNARMIERTFFLSGLAFMATFLIIFSKKVVFG
jgi:hypothetical protein